MTLIEFMDAHSLGLGILVGFCFFCLALGSIK
jgi:hypothetical protein